MTRMKAEQIAFDYNADKSNKKNNITFAAKLSGRNNGNWGVATFKDGIEVDVVY